jgi:hypothetical protein
VGPRARPHCCCAHLAATPQNGPGRACRLQQQQGRRLGTRFRRQNASSCEAGPCRETCLEVDPCPVARTGLTSSTVTHRHNQAAHWQSHAVPSAAAPLNVVADLHARYAC